jgi:putative chromate ion transporter
MSGILINTSDLHARVPFVEACQDPTIAMQQLDPKQSDRSVMQQLDPIESVLSIPESSETSIDTPEEKARDETYNNAPQLSYWTLFVKFLYFGINAWGGPVQQIALLKDKLVLEEDWISVKRFNRVYSVYQVLPGPEAAELCCFFGMLSRGRIGSVIAGLGFILPGFLLMLLACYIYYLIGFENPYFNSSFRAMQPIVAAFVLRAVHKIAEHAFIYHKTGKWDTRLFAMAIVAFLLSALRINFFITLAFFAVFWTLWDFWIGKKNKWFAISAGLLAAAALGGFIAYVVVTGGLPAKTSIAVGIAPAPPTLLSLFLLGLLAGLLSFGGAYTAASFLQAEAVVLGGWMTNQVFVDGFAIGNILPAPLVIVSTFVGFQGGLAAYGGSLGFAFAGAIIMTIGMFIPCFAFTLIGFELLEKAIGAPVITAALEGITASVVGLIAVVAAELLRYAVTVQLNSTHNATLELKLEAMNYSSVSAVLYCLTLGVFYVLKPAGNVPLLLVVLGAIAGQFLYLNA